jgi:hypothetical protein
MFCLFKRHFHIIAYKNYTVTVDAIKAYRLNRGIAVFIVSLRIRSIVQHSRPGHFTSRKETRFLPSRRLRVLQSRPGRFGENKKFLPLAEFNHLIFQAVV